MELRPGETTIVSWKRLIRDAQKASGSTSAAPEAPANAHPALESRIAPGQPAEGELNDAPAPNRFSAVIEKIERLYMGKQSSDEEDLDDFPDDDQYDTEDSFIDDAELDEYFQVDNSAIKHDGFFVNRGKLERIEPPLSPNHQSKKRRRKDLAKAQGESDDANVPNKHVKVGKTVSGKSAALVAKNASVPSQAPAVTSEHGEDMKHQNQSNASVICSKKKSADTKTTLDPSSLKVSNGSSSVALAEVKDERQKTGVLPSKNLGNKMKDASGFSDASHQRYHDKNAYTQLKSQSGRLSDNLSPLEVAARPREKNGVRELPETNVSESKCMMQTTKASHIHRKDGSSARPKGTMLEKAITELERMVAESRPPTMDVQDGDTSSQAVKRRLPPEIKLKLAKVARLAQASHGKISKELLNRLMSILGHLIQLRTLKRNLKVMINMGLSAKQEKDDRFQQIKKEVIEMIKMRVPSPRSKGFDQQVGSSDDFQEFGSEEKGVLKRKFSMGDEMEDKICDLYDLYVDGLEDDAGPQIRKLYAELAELWPNGSMDNHGIKRAICRAKDRKRALYSRHKDQEKIKRKKLLTSRTEDAVRVESSSIAQPQYARERPATDSGPHGLTASSKPVPNTTTAAVRMPSPSVNGPSLDKVKQEKVKISSGSSLDDPRGVDGALPKKKAKKPELESGEAHFRPEKLPSQQGEERQKSYKQATAPPSHKSNLHQSGAVTNFEQSS